MFSKLCVLFAGLCLSLVFVQGNKSSGKIIAGSPANIEDFPFVVQLFQMDYNFSETQMYMNGTQICTASYIGGVWVLTAGHCVAYDIIYNRPNSMFVRMGSSITNDFFDTRISVKLIMHPDIVIGTGVTQNDIGLIQIDSPFLVDNKFVMPVKLCILQRESIPLEEGTNVTIVGYGLTDAGINTPTTLNILQMKYMSLIKCELNEPIHNFICIDKYGINSGDSGSPLIHTKTGVQIGIASFIVRVDGAPSPSFGAFEYLDGHRDWLLKYIRNDGNNNKICSNVLLTSMFIIMSIIQVL